MSDNNHINADDWISTTEAAKLLPSPRGKRTSTGAIIRWIKAGKLQGKRRGRWWFIRRSEVLAMMGDVVIENGEAKVRVKSSAFTKSVLRHAGIETRE